MYERTCIIIRIILPIHDFIRLLADDEQRCAIAPPPAPPNKWQIHATTTAMDGVIARHLSHWSTFEHATQFAKYICICYAYNSQCFGGVGCIIFGNDFIATTQLFTHTHRTETAQRIIPTRLPVSVLFHWRRIQKNTFCNVQLSEIIFEIITIIFSECSFLYFSFFSSSIAALFLSSACFACSVCLVGCG